MTLLSFQGIPTQVYDVQVAFNTVGAFGEAAKISLAESESRIRRQYALLSGGRLPQVSLQLIHAPVFHGHTFSIAVEYERAVKLEEIEAILSGAHVEVIQGDADAPGISTPSVTRMFQSESALTRRALRSHEGCGFGPPRITLSFPR